MKEHEVDVTTEWVYDPEINNYREKPSVNPNGKASAGTLFGGSRREMLNFPGTSGSVFNPDTGEYEPIEHGARSSNAATQE